jgi:hypothetical protein
MMPVAYPRRVAGLLLRFAIWIAPHDTLDWGHGMLSELNHVRGDWAALIWALGGMGVLAKHTLLSVILPGSNRHTVSSAGGLFAKEGSMRKTTLAAIGVCAVSSFLFFLAPVFRQAFQVSLVQWQDLVHVQIVPDKQGSDSGLEALARKAEQIHDAEGLAFVAVRHGNDSESGRLAEESVRLDPSLTWVYAVVAVLHPGLSAIDRWVPELERWDPQNGLPYFIVAGKIDIDQVDRKNVPRQADEEPAAWQNAMAAAFQSPKIDNYLGRLKELDRRVLLRYHVDDPVQILGNYRWYGLSSYDPWDTSRYAHSLLESGKILEAWGDRKGAFEQYWTVATSGQMIEPVSGLFFVRQNLQETYKRLKALSEKEGNKVEATFYASLANQADIAQQAERIAQSERFNGSDVSDWNAFLVRLSGLTILFSGGLLTICALAVIVRARSLRLNSLRPSRLTLALGFGAAIGSLIASAMLYISYRPYAEILQRFIRKGDEAGLSELSSFLDATQVPLGAQRFQVMEFVFYFWFGVTLLCVLALMFVLVRHFKSRLGANATI